MAHSDLNAGDKASWDASGRTIEAAEAQGHAPEQLTAIQLALVSMGHTLTAGAPQERHEGDGVDGQWSDGTQAAIVQFQEDNGIEPTGKLDDETDEAILRAYGEALVASGAGDLFADGFDEAQLSDRADASDLSLPSDRASAVEDLAPGGLPDEPIADLLDDVGSGKTR